MTAAIRMLLYGEAGCCSCTGECGYRHPSGGCEVTRPSALTVAPADPTRITSPRELAAMPDAEQVLWCRPCLVAARRRGHAAQRLHDLTSVFDPVHLEVAA